MGIYLVLSPAKLKREKNEIPVPMILTVFIAVAICCARALGVLFHTGNYSGLVLSMYIAMVCALQHRKDCCAGFAWAVVMIKPQIGMLFFWPLVFQRRYRTIFTAVATCAAGVLAASAIYWESPLDLILQIPQIGTPYAEAWETLPRRILGAFMPARYVLPVQMVGGFIVCGILSWIFRNSALEVPQFFLCWRGVAEACAFSSQF